MVVGVLAFADVTKNTKIATDFNPRKPAVALLHTVREQEYWPSDVVFQKSTRSPNDKKNHFFVRKTIYKCAALV